MKQDCMLYDMRGNISKRFVMEKIAEKYQLTVDIADFLRYWEENAGIYAETFADVKEILADLRQTYRLACVTNGPKNSQMAKIIHAGLADSFDLIITSQEIGLDKPHPAIFEYCLQKLDTQAQEALFIGDTFSKDILGAVRCGIRAIWIADKRRPCAYPMERIEHISELKEILQNA